MKKYVTRLAPTPSGFLHSGNLLNFRLIQHFQKMTGAKLILRIDDLDSARVKDEYIEDIFRHLEWMNIQVDEGPSDLLDFKKNYSQQLKFLRYQKGLFDLQSCGAKLYQCRCTRKQIKKVSPTGAYPGTCRDLNLSQEEAPIVRFNTSAHPVLEREHGDFVLWRRNQEPAYHLVNVLEDLDQAVNFVIRGEDLQASSEIHRVLNSYLGFDEQIQFFHHPLVYAGHGGKLSKSQTDQREKRFYQSQASLSQLEQQWGFNRLARLLEDQLSCL